MYIRCINGNEFIQNCDDWLAFDAVLGVCNAETYFHCNNCQGHEYPELIFGHDARDCNRYFMCNGTETLAFRCAPGLYWDPIRNWCDFPSNVDCPHGTTPSPPLCSSTGVYEIPYSGCCNRFIRCLNGDAIIQVCAPGLGFDADRLSCIYQEDCIPCE